MVGQFLNLCFGVLLVWGSSDDPKKYLHYKKNVLKKVKMRVDRKTKVFLVGLLFIWWGVGY